MMMRMKLEAVVFTVMLLAASEGLKTISSVVGGNVTLPDPVPEEGFLLRKLTIIAQVFEKKLRIYEETSRNRIVWDQTSGLFTITELQKSDSGVYNIDSKRGKVFSVYYNLTVYDPAAPPAVWRLNSSSDSCWLLCSVDRLSSLSWFRGTQQLDRRDSVLLWGSPYPGRRLTSSFRCESSNPADESSVDVDVETFCSQAVEQEAAASTMQSDEESVESSSSDLLTRENEAPPIAKESGAPSFVSCFILTCPPNVQERRISVQISRRS
ncbi:hypothetical protein OJAV_G00011920 [Oryzias javanicus]|uniref:Ig-like domain-containing protein n=1 Tax=Oryzias javanicus TaxID=123683 RepID=A0A3S2N8L8_ORYJA|nr:hypothetical protein OJAV_G00011920 [Oryzias javanicus]